MTQWDFQNKGILTSPARLPFVLKVPLRHLRPSVIYSVPCDRILQRAYYTEIKVRVQKPWKPCPIYDQNGRNQLNLIPYLWPTQPKNHTLWGRTYLYSRYGGVPPPPRACHRSTITIHVCPMKNLLRHSPTRLKMNLGAFLWGDLDQEQWFKIFLEKNRWFHSGHGFTSTFDAPWSRRFGALILIEITPKERTLKSTKLSSSATIVPQSKCTELCLSTAIDHPGG